MIFVTVGMHNNGFDRLVSAVDDLAGEITEEVVIQRGSGKYIPKYAKHFQWTSSSEMEEWISKARLVISHAGAGTILLALKHAKPLVIAPRMLKFKEHLNDHQLQLASKMESNGWATCVETLTVSSLLDAVDRANKQVVKKGTSSELIGAIQKKLSTW